MMNVLTPRCGLRLLLPLIGFLLFGMEPLFAQKAVMTFTTQRGTGGVKNWTPDSTSVVRNGRMLMIRGMTKTGRQDIPWQTLQMVITDYAGPGTYRLTASTFFEDLFGSSMVKTDFQSGTITLTSDQATGFINGTFSAFLYSNPPNLPQVTTRIQNGALTVRPDSLLIEAKSKDDPLRASAGEKAKKINVIVTDELGGPIKDADVSVLNPVAGGAQALGKTNEKGELLYSFDVEVGLQTKMYEIRFSAAKTPYKKSAEIIKKIDISSRYWTYKCGGADLLTFDAGAGNEWKKRDDPSTVLDPTGSTVTINDLLHFRGTVSIDTATLVIDYTGKFYVPNVPLPGGSTGDLDLTNSETGVFRLTCDKKLKSALAMAKKKIGSLDVSIEELELVEVGIETGIKLKVKFEMEGVALGCKADDKPGNRSIAAGMVITSSGIESLSIEVANGLYYRPYFCLSELKFSYDRQTETFTAGATVKLQGSLGGTATLKGDMTIIKGVLDGANVDFESSLCYPLPPSIPFCVAGGRVGFSGRSTGFNTGGSIKAGLLFRSADQILFGKFPAIKRHLGDNPIAEINLDGKWEYPRKFTGEVKFTTLSIDLISAAKPWQIVVSGKVELDIDKDAAISGQAQLFHFGADDFVFSGLAEARYTWADDWAFVIKLDNATVKIPTIPDTDLDGTSKAVVKYLTVEGYIPAPLGKGAAYASFSYTKGTTAEAFIDVSSNPIGVIRRLGKMGIKLEKSDATGSKTRLTIMTGGKNLFSIGGNRKKGTEIQADGRNLPGPFVAHALDTFNVSPGLERMNIFIDGNASVPPVAYLIAPNGTRHDATNGDSSIIIPSNTPGNVRWLTVVNPAPGRWILGLVNPKTTDSVTVLLPAGDTRSFAIAAAAAGRKVTVTWNATGLSNSDIVAINLDNVDGRGGNLVGMADATAGRYEFTFNDSYTECAYKVNATLSGGGYLPVTANADGEFSTGKSILPAPQNIVVTPVRADHARVNWTASPDPAVVHYMIYVRGKESRDSLLEVVPAFATSAELSADTATLRTLFIRSANIDGVTGCAAGISSIGTLSVEDERRVATGASISSINVVPNPVSGSASIRWRADRSASVVVEIKNLLGVTVARIDAGRCVEGINEVHWNTEGIADGSYLAVIYSGTTTQSAKFVVVR